MLADGWRDSARQKAYAHAVKSGQQLTAESAPAVIAEYQWVIALQPDSAYVRQTRVRIEAVKAGERRKSVLQEHGID